MFTIDKENSKYLVRFYSNGVLSASYTVKRLSEAVAIVRLVGLELGHYAAFDANLGVEAVAQYIGNSEPMVAQNEITEVVA